MEKRKKFLIMIVFLIAIFIVFLVYQANRVPKTEKITATSDELELYLTEASDETAPSSQAAVEETDKIYPTSDNETIPNQNSNETKEINLSEQILPVSSPNQNYTIKHDYVKPTQEPTYSDSEIETDKWKSFALSLNNTTYTFPLSADELKASGYGFDKKMKSNELEYGAVSDPVIYRNDEKKSFIQVYITNRSDLTLTYEKCEIIGMNLNLDSIADNDLSIAIEGERIYKGMHSQALISAIGEPTTKSNKNTSDTFTYQNAQGNKTWVFGFENNELIGIYIYVSPT